MNTPSMLKVKGVVPPPYGWEENTYYIVDVAFNAGNPIHRSIFFSGFLNGRDGGPGGYNAIFNPTYEDTCSINKAYYMKVVGKLLTQDEMDKGSEFVCNTL